MSAPTTTLAAANRVLVQDLTSAFLRGDLATVGSFFAPDAVWDFPGRSILNGVYTGPEQIVGFLARSFELSGGSLRVELIDITASAHGATQVQWVSADHGGRSFRAVELLHHEIVDGAIVRTWHRSDEGAITGFFGAA
jgi:ketosteroid isomerase-like protein